MGRSIRFRQFFSRTISNKYCGAKRFYGEVYDVVTCQNCNCPHPCPGSPSTVYPLQTGDCRKKKRIQFILCFISQRSLENRQTTSIINLADKFLVPVFPKDLTITATLLDMTGQHTSKMQAFSMWMHGPGPAHVYTHTRMHARTQQVIPGDIRTKAPACAHICRFR